MLPRSKPSIALDEILDRIAVADEINDEAVLSFEEEFARYLPAPRCIATNQARAGLLLALQSIGIAPGDEVIVQGFTYWGVINAIVEAGATPRLVDAELSDLHAAPDAIEQAVTDRTRAIVASHLFGLPCAIDELAALADERGLLLIEDCAQCMGARCSGKKVGTFGDFSFFSFSIEKHMTTGEGGMLVVNNPAYVESLEAAAARHTRVSLDEEKVYAYGLLFMHAFTDRSVYRSASAYLGQEMMRRHRDLFGLVDGLVARGSPAGAVEDALLRYIRIHGLSQPPRLERNPLVRIAKTFADGFRSRTARIGRRDILMHSLRASLGLLGLSDLGAVNAIRNRNAARYAAMLDGTECYLLPSMDGSKDPAYLKYNVLNTSDVPMSEVIRASAVRGYELGNSQWARPVHLARQCRGRPLIGAGGVAHCEYIADRIINLPVHAYVTDEDIEGIVRFLEELPPRAGGSLAREAAEAPPQAAST